jgi:hypothetical protein
MSLEYSLCRSKTNYSENSIRLPAKLPCFSDYGGESGEDYLQLRDGKLSSIRPSTASCQRDSSSSSASSPPRYSGPRYRPCTPHSPYMPQHCPESLTRPSWGRQGQVTIDTTLPTLVWKNPPPPWHARSQAHQLLALVCVGGMWGMCAQRCRLDSSVSHSWLLSRRLWSRAGV